MISVNRDGRYFSSNTGIGNRVSTVAGNAAFAIWHREEAHEPTGKASTEGSKHLISDRFRDNFFISTNLFLTYKNSFHGIGRFLNNIILLAIMINYEGKIR